MPYRRRLATSRPVYRRRRPVSTRERVYRRRNTSYRRIARPVVGKVFPKSMILRSKVFSDALTYAPVATTGFIQLHLNSFYDPFGGLDDNSYQYFVEVSGIYTTYRVLKCFYKITLYNIGAGTDTLRVSWANTDSLESPATLREGAQIGKYLDIPHSASPGNSNKRIIKGSWALRQAYPRNNINSDKYSAEMGDEPTGLQVATIQFGMPTENVHISYHVEMWCTVQVYGQQQNTPDDVE